MLNVQEGAKVPVLGVKSRGQPLGFLVALAVVVGVTLARSPAHAATAAEDAVTWNPGQVTYQLDSSGCHTIQEASLDTATTEVADSVSAGLDAKKRKEDYSDESGVKATEVNNIRKNGTHIDVTIDGWLSNDACQQAGGPR
jgi:hypothetical protein